jgi:hypothetical protein
MAAIPVEPEVRSRGGASSAARSRFAADSLLEGVGFEPSVPGESRGSRQVNILQILAGRLSGYPTVGRCGDVRFRALVKGSMAWLLCLPVGQASSLASSCCSTLFLLTRAKTGLSARDQRFESGSLQRGVSCEPEFSGGHPINARRTFQLQQRGIEKIIVVGVLANTCVEATARCSAELGYHVTLVRDATAAFSSEAMHPPQIWLGSYAKLERTRRGHWPD